MARCVDHPSAEENIRTNAERFGSNMALVVTRSDDNVDKTLAQTMQRKGQSVGDFFTLEQHVNTLDRQLLVVTRQLEGGKKKGTKRQRTELDQAREAELKSQKSSLMEERQRVKTEQFGCLVDCRNSHNIGLLQQNKQQYMPAGVELAVFCVSNTHYAVHLEGHEPDGPLLDVADTGILSLRAWLLSMAAPQLLRQVEGQIGDAAVIVRGVSLWAQNTPQKRKAGILDIVRAPERTWDAAIDQALTAANCASQSSIIDRLQQSFQQILNAALRYYRGLEEWHDSTLRAFFGRNGKHVTGKQPYTVWNENFTHHQAKQILDPHWNKITEQQRKAVQDAVDALVDQLRNIPAKLTSSEAAIATQINNITGLIDEHVRGIRRAHGVRSEDYAKDLSNIKQKATFDEPSSYFTKAMSPMYDRCKTMRGRSQDCIVFDTYSCS